MFKSDIIFQNRLLNSTNKAFTKRHQDICNDLFKLCMSRYSEVSLHEVVRNIISTMGRSNIFQSKGSLNMLILSNYNFDAFTISDIIGKMQDLI